jgi:NAD(P)-dependent dehydrogenase (short-subunit alcohol dehydrogenase family)
MLEGRTVLVTGGAVRIGRAIVEALAAAGAGVVVHARSSQAAAEELVAAIRGRGGRAWQVSGTLETPDGVEGVFRVALAASGTLDGLVNNAAIFTREPLVASGAAAFEAAWRLNALAPMLLTRLLAAQVAPGAAAPVAGVVNLLDQRIAHPCTGCIPYLVSKQALAAFTTAAALELAPGVTVNAVAPGAVLAPPRTVATAREPAGAAPLASHGTPAQIAAAVVFLLANPSITGQILYVDGGQHLVGESDADA